MNHQPAGARTAMSASSTIPVRADKAARAPGSGSWKGLSLTEDGYFVTKSTTVVWSAGGASPLRIFSAASMPNTAS